MGRMETIGRPSRYSPDIQDRKIWMAWDQTLQHGSQWVARRSETLAGKRPTPSGAKNLLTVKRYKTVTIVKPPRFLKELVGEGGEQWVR